MVEILNSHYQKSQDELIRVMDLCRDELTVRELRIDADTWQAKVALLTLELTIKHWRKDVKN